MAKYKSDKPQHRAVNSQQRSYKKEKQDEQGFKLLSDERLPEIRKRGNVLFIINKDTRRFKLSWRMTFTLLLVFFVALGSTFTGEQLLILQNQINSYNRALRTQRDANWNLENQIRTMYTRTELERLASERLGMAYPDPSQRFFIDVPRQSHVELNTADYLLPTQNYFFRNLWNFIRGS